MLHEVNFPIAWNILDQRYTNKCVLTSHYFKNLVDVPIVKPTAKSVNVFRETVQESLKTLNGLNLSAEKLLQAFVLIRKLDDQLKIKYELSVENVKEVPKVSSLLQFLEYEFYTLDICQDNKNNY